MTDLPPRPKRTVPFSITHSWQSQEWQYRTRTDIPKAEGIVHWTVPSHLAPVRIECLLFFWRLPTPALNLLGICNYYPEGSPQGEQPHDTLTLVHPDFRRLGIGSALLREAMRRWPQIKLADQTYTAQGWALVNNLKE